MIYYSVDVGNYDPIDDVYYIEGWGFLENLKQVDISAHTIEGKMIPCNIVRKQRSDVLKAYADRPPVEMCGFCIEFRDVAKIINENIDIVIDILGTQGEKKECRWECQKVIDDVRKKTILYDVDVCEIQGKYLVLQGWFFNRKGKDEIYLLDSKNHKVLHEQYRILRKDVNEMFQLTDDTKCGFNLKVELTSLKTSTIFIVFKNELVDDRTEIDIKKMRFDVSTQGKLWNVLKPERFNENIELIKKEGFRTLVEQIKKEINPQYSDYDAWIRAKELSNRQKKEQKKDSAKFAYRPLISIVIPLYNTPIPYLKKIVESIQKQTYDNWQLCLADGSSTTDVERFINRRYKNEQRITYKKLKKNGGISANTNEALRLARGEFILLADHDDIILPQALCEIVKVLNEHPETEIVYTDEDKISMNGKMYFGPNFKPDFSIDLLHSVNYICHIFMVKKTIVDEIGEFRSEYDGAQDYDFILRCCEKTNHIYHIPQVLYHWRSHPDSTAENPENKRYAFDAGRRAIQEHYRRIGWKASVEDGEYLGIYRNRFEIDGNPKISIIILNKDHIDDLDKCISSILRKSSYQNYEIIVAENNSEEKSTFDYYDKITEKDPRIKVVYWKGEGGFNYSAINNFAAKSATGEYFVLLNNDIEVISENWLEEMLGYCQRKEVGIVGAKLYYPDHTIQHAGVVLGMGGIAGHILCQASGDEPGYNGRLVTVQDMTAVTAACMMVKSSVYEEVDGLDESFKVAFNDIDFCMKVREKGYLVVFTPYAELYHYESKSRGLEDTPEKQMRFAGEIKKFQEKWAEELKKGDPYYNSNLSLQEGDCSLRI